MKNITLSLDTKTCQPAPANAAVMDTSPSASVKRGLDQLAPEERNVEESKQKEHTLRESIRNFTASDRLSRQEVHERHGLS